MLSNDQKHVHTSQIHSLRATLLQAYTLEIGLVKKQNEVLMYVTSPRMKHRRKRRLQSYRNKGLLLKRKGKV